MPDIFITLHSEAIAPDALLGVVPALRRGVEDWLGADRGAAVVQILRPQWSTGYDDIDIQVFAAPSDVITGRTRQAAENIAQLVVDHVRKYDTTVKSLGSSVRIFAESSYVNHVIADGGPADVALDGPTAEL
jgi:hypothetical protein